jgi:hypothetical protein
MRGAKRDAQRMPCTCLTTIVPVTIVAMSVITTVIVSAVVWTAIVAITPTHYHDRWRRIHRRRCVIHRRRRGIHWIRRGYRHADADTDRHVRLCSGGHAHTKGSGNNKRNELFHFSSPGAALPGGWVACLAYCKTQCIQKGSGELCPFVANCNCPAHVVIRRSSARNWPLPGRLENDGVAGYRGGSTGSFTGLRGDVSVIAVIFNYKFTSKRNSRETTPIPRVRHAPRLTARVTGKRKMPGAWAGHFLPADGKFVSLL